MSHRLRLLPHGLVRLIVCPVHDGVHFLFPRSALIEKEFGECKVALLARVFVKPHEGKLDLGMSARRKARVPAHVKALIDIVRILLHGRQQIRIDAAPVERHGGLDEMPGTVQLVLRTLHKDLFRLVNLIVTVEIAARKLILYDRAHRLVDDRAHLRVRKLLLKICSRFQPLGDVRIKENMRRIFLLFAAERVEASRLLEPAIDVFQRNSRIARAYLLPESVFERNALIPDGRHTISSENIFFLL